MSNTNYKFSVVFFKENSGREPVKEWIKEELDLDERKKLGKSIEIIQER